MTAPQHILAGEAGPEIIIPLSVGRRNRAKDLLTKTLNILNGNADAAGFNSSEKLQTQSSQEETNKLGNLKAYQGMANNLIKVGDLSPIIDAKLREQRKYVHNQRKQSEELQMKANLSAQEAKILSSIPSFETDELGNLKGYEGLKDNLINENDDLLVRRKKQKAQKKAMGIYNDSSVINAPADMASASTKSIEDIPMPNQEPTPELIAFDSLERDNLGNFKGYTGSLENLVQEGDLSPIRDAKLAAQAAEMGMPEFAPDDNETLPSADEMPISNNSSNNVSIELGGVTPTFNIEGGDNPQAIMEAIRSQVEDVADLIGGTIAEKISAIHGNQGVLT